MCGHSNYELSLIAHSSAANYQAVINLSPTYYYELNETTTEMEPLTQMGNAPKNGEYNGFYGEERRKLVVKVHFTCLVQTIQME